MPPLRGDEKIELVDNVVVTGFGLFRDHVMNPSWEAIKDGRLRLGLPNVNIITRQVDVCYETVDRLIDELWQVYKPILMVHVGLAAFEKQIRIERVARHGPYLHDDVKQDAPHKELRDYGQEARDINVRFTCKPCSFECSKTRFDIERVCEKLNTLHQAGELPISFKMSEDAGLYVCEYIYQRSLRICDRAVFIHVPDVGEQFKLEDITRCLNSAIELLLEELNSLE